MVRIELLVGDGSSAGLLWSSSARRARRREEEEEEEEEPVVGEPQHGGTLTVINSCSMYEPVTWDPADLYEMGQGFYSPIYEKLLTGDYLNKGPRGTNEWPFTNFNYVPESVLTGCLAESWEFPDPLTLVYHIRKGVYFPDKPGVMESREYTAYDTKYAFDRFFEESGITSPSARWDFILLGEVEATDRYTLTIRMPEFFPSAITWTTCGFLLSFVGYPRELVDAGFAWENVTGTGPFMLENVVKDAYISYKRNPNYWGRLVIGGKEYQLPFIDGFDQLLVVDPMTQLAALRTGEADILTPVALRHAKSLEETNPELIKFKGLDSVNAHLSLDCTIPPLNDLRVRRAMFLAVDQKAIGDALYEEYELFNWPITAADPIFTPIEELPEETRELFEYHPDKARQLLAEAGYPDGFTVDALVPPNQAFFMNDDLMDFVHHYWGEVGITLDINKQEESVFWNLIGERGYTTVLEIWGASAPQLAMEDYSTGELVFNMSHLVDAQLIEWRDESQRTVDYNERMAILNKMNDRVTGLAAHLVFPTPYSYSYCWPWVKNWFGETAPIFMSPQVAYPTIWIDKDLKSEMGY